MKPTTPIKTNALRIWWELGQPPEHVKTWTLVKRAHITPNRVRMWHKLIKPNTKAMEVVEFRRLANHRETYAAIPLDPSKDYSGQYISLEDYKKGLEQAFEAARERLNHPDYDFIHEDFQEWFNQYMKENVE